MNVPRCFRVNAYQLDEQEVELLLVGPKRIFAPSHIAKWHTLKVMITTQNLFDLLLRNTRHVRKLQLLVSGLVRNIPPTEKCRTTASPLFTSHQ